jgi:hypothetical protein
MDPQYKKSAEYTFYTFHFLNNFNMLSNVCMWMKTHFNCSLYVKCLCKCQSPFWLPALFAMGHLGIPLPYKPYALCYRVKANPLSGPIICTAFNMASDVTAGNVLELAEAFPVDIPDSPRVRFSNKNFLLKLFLISFEWNLESSNWS